MTNPVVTDILKSKKLSRGLTDTLQRMNAQALPVPPANEKSLTVIFSATAAPALAGVEVKDSLGPVHTARVSLTGIRELANDSRVSTIYAGPR